jgi:hypothetical protein
MKKIFSFIFLIITVSPLLSGDGGNRARSTFHPPAPEKTLNILFISSFSKDPPAQVDFERGLDAVLGFRSGNSNFFAEFLEAPRIRESAVTGVFRFYLERKYRDIRFDFIIAWASRATDFIAANRDLFPGARRILVEDTAGADGGKSGRSADAIHIGIQEDFRATLDEIMRIADPKRG